MKEILKIIYIAVCLAVCLYPIYRWIEDAVYEIGSYFKHIHHSKDSNFYQRFMGSYVS